MDVLQKPNSEVQLSMALGSPNFPDECADSQNCPCPGALSAKSSKEKTPCPPPAGLKVDLVPKSSKTVRLPEESPTFCPHTDQIEQNRTALPPPVPPPRQMLQNFVSDAWLKFRLLMWKNFLQQWRRPAQTVAELLLPILTMMFILIIRKEVVPAHRGGTSYPPIPAYTLTYSMQVVAGMESGKLSVVYSPKSPILQDVVQSAMATLLSQNQNLVIKRFGLAKRIQPFLRTQVSRRAMASIESFLTSNCEVTAYENSKALEGLYAKEETTRNILAAIQFDDKLYEATELPNNKLSYSLRFPERPRLNSFYSIGGRDWKTDMIFPSYEVPGPRFPYSFEGGNDPGYVDEMFTPLQHALSTELIRRLTGQNIKDLSIVNIQRFPHPPYWEDNLMTVMKLLLPMFVMMSASYSAFNIVRAIVAEKELQLKESMKIMGLPTWLHWTAWFWKQFIFQIIIALIMTILLKVRWFQGNEGTRYGVFTHTPCTVIFFFLLLYFACMIYFCFFLSAFFSKGSTAALFTGIIWFFTFMPAFILSTDSSISVAGQMLSCLFINTAMAFGFQLILAHESSGGLQWGKFLSSPSTEQSRFMFGHVAMMLILDCFIFMLATLYLEQVYPGPSGTPQPWNFPFKSEFWYPDRKYGRRAQQGIDNNPKGKMETVARLGTRTKNKSLRAFYVSVVQAYQSAVRAFGRNNVPNNYGTIYKVVQEKDPENLSIGVHIKNLTKVFGQNTIVDRLNLNVYNDQITVLLGHNGAGKTTTISMITGILRATSGQVIVAGYDMSTQAAIARSHIGLCPQHDVLFDELTVREHLQFFSRLKGLKGAELKADIDELIKKLELEPKRDYQSKGLSGGQKRRLCVGIALSGHAKVVLLDEPTSGMDPASRRGLWDLLQKEKINRSMILTTHFMDEADILGDRVAIMALGRLQCIGTPYFLKHHYGMGYTLVLVKGKNFNTEGCTSLINNYIPGTVVKEDRGTEVTYSLPNEYSHKFEDILSNLEHNVKSIDYTNYGLLATTLEDVFMAVGADLEPVMNKDESSTKGAGSTTEKETNEVTAVLEQFNSPKSANSGLSLLKQRVLAVWLKLALIWRRSWWLAVIQFIIPTLLLTAALGLLQYILSVVPNIKKRKLSLDTGFEETETLMACDSNSTIRVLAAEAYREIFDNSKVSGMTVTPIGEEPMHEYYLERTSNPLVMNNLRNRIVIGSTFTDTVVTAWFSNFGYHDVAMSLHAVHSALLRAYKPDSELTVYNHPLRSSYKDQTDISLIIGLISMLLSTAIGSSVAMTTAVFIMFYIKERVSGAKLLQRSAGLEPAVMWGSAAAYDFAWLLIFCLPISLACVMFDVPGLSSGSELLRLWVCIIMYSLAIIPLTFLLSLLFNGPALGFVCYLFINVIMGMLGAQVVEPLQTPGIPPKTMTNVLEAILQVHPLYCLISCIRYLNQIGLYKRKCIKMCEIFDVLFDNFKCTMANLCELDDTCCLPSSPYLQWAAPGVLRYLTAMFFMGIVFWTLLMIIEHGLLKQVFNREKRPPPIDKRTHDDDVAAEAQHAEEVYKTSLAKQALLALKLSKYYKKYLAVNQVTFCVNDGECFGLLGVNGAGKTTTFKMLMGDEDISSGEAFVSGYSVKKKLHKAHESIGYCPQFDALFMELTGRETLRIFAMMRGLRQHCLPSTIETFSNALGFRRHLDKQVYKYSGGNRRKLNTAVAFLGKTRLIFVDEPTTGVDPAAKRHVWRAVRGVQNAGRGVVLTSHSMEECEALCSRLTIMVNGRFQCIGTPQHLKNKFTQGFTLTIKMKSDESKPPSQDQVARVKEYVNLNFKDPKIMEELQGTLTYYLPDKTIAWSRMFGIMERGKQELDIEDYTITQTSLEQIFLQFTKYIGMKQTPKMD